VRGATLVGERATDISLVQLQQCALALFSLLAVPAGRRAPTFSPPHPSTPLLQPLTSRASRSARPCASFRGSSTPCTTAVGPFHRLFIRKLSGRGFGR
jgi:hypothetical protein